MLRRLVPLVLTAGFAFACSVAKEPLAACPVEGATSACTCGGLSGAQRCVSGQWTDCACSGGVSGSGGFSGIGGTGGSAGTAGSAGLGGSGGLSGSGGSGGVAGSAGSSGVGGTSGIGGSGGLSGSGGSAGSAGTGGSAGSAGLGGTGGSGGNAGSAGTGGASVCPMGTTCTFLLVVSLCADPITLAQPECGPFGECPGGFCDTSSDPSTCNITCTP